MITRCLLDDVTPHPSLTSLLCGIRSLLCMTDPEVQLPSG